MWCVFFIPESAKTAFSMSGFKASFRSHYLEMSKSKRRKSLDTRARRVVACWTCWQYISHFHDFFAGLFRACASPDQGTGSATGQYRGAVGQAGLFSESNQVGGVEYLLPASASGVGTLQVLGAPAIPSWEAFFGAASETLGLSASWGAASPISGNKRCWGGQ